MKLKANEVNKTKSWFSEMHNNMNICFLSHQNQKKKQRKINNKINEKGDRTTE